MTAPEDDCVMNAKVTTVESLLATLDTAPDTLEFADVMQVIDSAYTYTPTNFTCGSADNSAGTNEGSCKILAFAKMHDLSAEKTPYLFGRYYRDDVLKFPEEKDHANIRNFIRHGWDGVSFENSPLC